MADTTQHICRVGTARIDYQGRGGQQVLNTTVKSGTGLGAVFAPTWQMVMQSKRDKITWDEYHRQYTALMRRRYQANTAAFLEVLNSDELIVCCYCRDTHATTQHVIGTFSSRYWKKSRGITASASSLSAKSAAAGEEPSLFLSDHITN